MEKFNRKYRILNRLRRLSGYVLDRLLLLDFFTSSSKDQIRLHNLNLENASNEDTYLIYGTWSKDSLLIDCEKEFITSIKTEFKVMIVTNSKNVDPWIIENKFSFVWRKNSGRDLGALRDTLSLLQRLDLSPKRIIWINSSMYWNYSKFLDIYRNRILDLSEKFPVVSMTDSFQVCYHIQSYFFVFNTAFLQRLKKDRYRLPFKNFFFKRSLINYGEREFVNWLESKDLAYAVIFPVKEFVNRDFYLYNPPLHLYKELMLEGMPGFKLAPKVGSDDRRTTANEIWVR
jgi:hypothetical protein